MEASRGPSLEQPTRRRLETWRWPITVGVLGMLALGLIWLVAKRLAEAAEKVAHAPVAAAEALAGAARGMLTGDVTTRFLSSIPEVTSPRGGNLELAVVTNIESFERTDDRRALWDLLPLGRTVVGIRVPVVYRYHVPLSESWSATISEGQLSVVAARLRPSLPPAIRLDRMERRVEADWSRFDGAERLAELEGELLPLLVARARDPRHLDLAREPARRAVSEFARAFLLREGFPVDGEVSVIRVRFEDEPESASVRDAHSTN